MRREIWFWLFVFLVGLVWIGSVHAATLSYQFDPNTIVSSEFGEEIINGYAANLTIVALTNNSQPFTLGNIPGADTIQVTIQFLNPLGQAVDVTGDGVEDTFTATENASNPGTYEASLNLSARPGEYTMRIHAVATNSSTGEILEEGTLDVQVYIADPYWVTVWTDQGEKVQIGSLSFEIDAMNERGAVVLLGESLVTLSPDSTTGEIFRQVDLDGDGSLDTWMFIKSSESGPIEVKFYSRNNIIDEPEDKIDVKGDTVTREAWLKNGRSYRQIVLWDNGPLSFLKAEDYYIIPYKGGQYWKEGWGSGYSGKVAIIKRTTYLGLFSKEEKVFDGNIFGRSVGDDVLKVFGRWAKNLARIPGGWEVVQGIAKMLYPDNYELRFRQAAIPAELEFRGKFTLPSIFGESVDWKALISGIDTTETTEEAEQ